MADVSQIKLPNGSVYDLIDEKSGYITAQYIEDKTDYEIPVSRVGEIVVGETAIGTDSTNFPTSKAVVDYVDERVVQEMDAIDVGVTGIKANGTSLTVENGVVNIPAIGPNQSVGLMTLDVLYSLTDYIQSSIPTSTSQLTNNSGFITASDIPAETDPTVPAWAKASTKPTYTANEVGALPSDTVITDEKLKVSLTSDNDTYYPILTSNSTEAQTKLRYSGLDFIITSDGAQLRIGNTSFSDLKMGKLTLTKYTYFTTIIPSNNGRSNTITLPNKTGTVALLDDIPTVPTNISSFTNDSGYLTASDIVSVMTYKGTKANYAALPSTGNTTGDVWHLTDTGAEWAWDGSAWQELGTAIDLSNYVTTNDSRLSDARTPTAHNQALSTITDADDLKAIEALSGTSGLLKKTAANTWTLDTNTYLTSYTEVDPTVPSWAKAQTKPSYSLTEISGTDDLRAIEALTGTSGLLKKTAANTWTLDTNTYLTSYTETDPVFNASAAAGITSSDITNWNNKTSNTGTVTSVRVQASSPLQSSVNTAQSTSLNTTISFNNQNANVVLAGPSSGNAAAPTFRSLVAADIPNLSWSKITSDKPTSLSGYGITDAYTKTEIDNKVSSVLRYKGVKAAISNLPTTGNVVGDVWHVTATSGEYAWDGTEWQELGTAITIPAATGSSTTGISIADHSTTDIYGVSSSTTSVTGVSGSTSVYGVKSGTNSTTTASHVKSGGNGTAPTLGTAISIYGVKSGTNSTTTASHVKSGGNGSAPTLGTAIVVRGVKTGTNSTTTASKASGGNGSAPTLGTPISVPNVTSVGTAPTWSFTDVTIPIRADADTTVPTAAFSATTVPIKNTSATTVPTAASSATTVPIKNTDATACDDITAWSAGSGSFTSGTFDGGSGSASLTFTMDTTDTKKLKVAFSHTHTPATHGADSHTHTAPSLSYTARSIIGVQSTTTSVTGVSGSTSIYGVQSTTTSVTGVSGSTTVRGVKTGTNSTTTASKASGGNGTAPTLGDPISIPNVTSVGSAPTWSFTDVTVPIRADADTSIPNVTSVGSASNWVFEDVTVPIRADSATSIPNVTSVGSASNWVFEDITVPIRADSATTVPTAASSATTVPIKNGTATTVVTGKSHSITDNGHTHTI